MIGKGSSASRHTPVRTIVEGTIALRGRGVRPDNIEFMLCKVTEGTVHRLWEPRSEKDAPSTPYSAKFSVPCCIAVALIDGTAGLEQFSEKRVGDEALCRLAAKVRYEIDPMGEYPGNHTSYARAHFADGSVVEAKQAHLRGGRREPLTHAEPVAKMQTNPAFGGWPAERASTVADFNLAR